MKLKNNWSPVIITVFIATIFMAGCAKESTITQDTKADQMQADTTPKADPAPVEEEVVSQPATEVTTSDIEETKPTQEVMTPTTGKSTLGFERIHFDFDKSAIKEEYRAVLQRNAAYMRDNPGMSIVIAGHCDERGTAEYNLALGERRAQTTLQYMVDLGIDPNRMSIKSYGEELPLETGQSEAAWAMNRRAEFVVK